MENTSPPKDQTGLFVLLGALAVFLASRNPNSGGPTDSGGGTSGTGDAPAPNPDLTTGGGDAIKTTWATPPWATNPAPNTSPNTGAPVVYATPPGMTEGSGIYNAAPTAPNGAALAQPAPPARGALTGAYLLSLDQMMQGTDGRSALRGTQNAPPTASAPPLTTSTPPPLANTPPAAPATASAPPASALFGPNGANNPAAQLQYLAAQRAPRPAFTPQNTPQIQARNDDYTKNRLRQGNYRGGF